MSFMQSMGTNNFPLIAAFFIGLMTALSPCPLATNITAIAYISKKNRQWKKNSFNRFCLYSWENVYLCIAGFSNCLYWS